MSEIAEKYREFKATLPGRVRLIAVSKTKPVEEILELYQLGHRDFGENKVQEMVAKAASLPRDIHWHMVGHLQRNKVKYISSFVAMIHSVDSLRLLETINKEGERNGKRIDCLLQVHIASEETKYGFSGGEIMQLDWKGMASDFPYARIRGLMGMATFTDEMEKVRLEFRNLKTLFEKIRLIQGTEHNDFTEISMGMSNDFPLAVEEGATMIRIGSLIFGERNYH